MSTPQATEKESHWWLILPVGFFVVIVGGIAWFIIALIVSENKREKECEARVQECGLFVGTRVVSVLDGTPGMVTRYYCGTVWVRFAASANRTDTHILGRDGVIEREPYAVTNMGCYEVSRAE